MMAPELDDDGEARQLRQDAARYRWLRDNPQFQIEYTGDLTLDQCIDRAMQPAAGGFGATLGEASKGNHSSQRSNRGDGQGTVIRGS
jgi:hypothetical protein